MQSVAAGFTAEARDTVRDIAHDLQVSWHKQSTLSSRTFAVGVSAIGGSDAIGVNPSSLGTPGVYRYFDETSYVTELAWDRSLNIPLGGISKAFGEARLDNTSGRFTPIYMGGRSELYTAILPRRPAIISAGFDINGVSVTLPQFSGIFNKQPVVDARQREVHLQMSDYIDFFENRYLDETAMFTGQRSDQIMEYYLTNQLGLSTSDYLLDQGIQNIPFVIAPAGKKFINLFNELVQAEQGYFYQDESGIFKFENRQHWDNAPYNAVVASIYTTDVLEARTVDEDHIINVVEIKANPRAKQSLATIFTLSGTIELTSGKNEVFIDFANPVLAANAPAITANTSQDGSGVDVSASITRTSTSLFAQSVKYVLNNTTGTTAYITALTIQGRQATERYPDKGIYYRAQDDSSVTAYEERVLSIENDYIQDANWAASLAALILTQFSDPESMQTIVIRAKPHLQLGDLINWQSRSWRIFDIKSTLDPSVGYIQELKLLSRTIQTYFRIGISTIGGPDKIAS